MQRVKSFTKKQAKTKPTKIQGSAAMTSLVALVALGGASTYLAYVASNAAELLIPSVQFQLPATPSILQKSFKFDRVATRTLSRPSVTAITVSVPSHAAYVPGVEFETVPSEPVAIHGERTVFAQLAVRFNLIIGAQALDADQIMASMNISELTTVANQAVPSTVVNVAALNTQNIASSGIVKNEMTTQRRGRKKLRQSVMTEMTPAPAVSTQVALSDVSGSDAQGNQARLDYSELLRTLGVSKVKSIDTVAIQPQVQQLAAVNTQVSNPVVATQVPSQNRLVATKSPVLATQSLASEEATIIESGNIVSGARGPSVPQQTSPALNTHVATPAPEAEVATQQIVTLPFGGLVTEAFSSGSRPVEGAKVQIIGSNLETYTDASGSFTFKNLEIQGVLPVMISKDLFFWRRVDLKAGTFTKVELIAENAVNAAVMALGKTRQNETGFVFGQLYDPAGQSLAAFTVHLLGIEDRAESEVASYVTGKGIPSAELAFTDDRGQFIFSNVKPGTYLMVITDVFGQDRAPHIIRVGAGEGIIKKFSIGSRIMVSGQVLNATMQNAPVADASVQILGATKSGTSDKDGHFYVGPTYLDCDELNFIQVEKQGFYRNRLPYKCVATTDVENPLYVFSRAYIDSVAGESEVNLNHTAGLVMGHLSFDRPVKTQLLGPEEMNPSSNSRGMDFYFDRDGVLNPDRETTSQNGNFSIMNAPAGLSYLQAFDHENNALVIVPVLVAPSTVNVSIQ